MGQENKHTAIYTAYDDIVPFDPAEPERNLLRAILMTALSDLEREGEPQRRARQYLLSEEEDYIFSFRSICNHLNIDPKRVLVLIGMNDAPGESPTSDAPSQYRTV